MYQYPRNCMICAKGINSPEEEFGEPRLPVCRDCWFDSAIDIHIQDAYSQLAEAMKLTKPTIRQIENEEGVD